MNRDFHIALLAFFLAASVVSADDPETNGELHGTWRQVLVVNDGRPRLLGGENKTLATIKDDEYTVTSNGLPVIKGSIKIDSKKGPIETEITHAEGPWAGSTVFGISKIEGDIMIECIGTQRPTEFRSAAGSGNTLMVWLRVK